MFQIIAKILALSFGITLLIKGLSPFIPQTTNHLAVLAIVLSPSVLVGMALIKNE